MKRVSYTTIVILSVIALSFALTVLQNVTNSYEWMVAFSFAIFSSIVLIVMVVMLISDLVQTDGKRLPKQSHPPEPAATLGDNSNGYSLRPQSEFGRKHMPNRDRSFERKACTERIYAEPVINQEQSSKPYRNGRKPLWQVRPTDNRPSGFEDVRPKRN